MYKNILFSWILFLPTLLLAQNNDFAEDDVDYEENKVFTIGLQGGLTNPYTIQQNNYESLRECPTINGSELAYDRTIKGAASLKFSYSMTRNWGISSGLEYMGRGQNYKDTFRPGGNCGNEYRVVRQISLHYLQLPLYVQYRARINNKFHYVIDLGFYGAVLLGGSEEVNSGGEELQNIDPIEFKYRNFDAGVSMQHSFQYAVTRKLFISLGFRIDFGLVDINSEEVQDLDWYEEVDKDYERSNNLLWGIHAGVHYRFLRQKSPFNKGAMND